MARKLSIAKRLAATATVAKVAAVPLAANATGTTLDPVPAAAPLGPARARPPNREVLRSLDAERKRLLGELRHQELIEQEHPTTGNHMADDASEVSEQAKTLALRRHLEGMVQEIDKAIVRAERGMYGICENCGRSISVERLRVMPSASQCIECAKLHARNFGR